MRGALSQQCYRILRSLQGPQLLASAERISSKVQSALNNEKAKLGVACLEVAICGNVAMGTALGRYNDIDIMATTTPTILTGPPLTQLSLRSLEIISRSLKTSGMKNVISIPTARVPIVKFVVMDPDEGLTCDLSFNNPDSLSRVTWVRARLSQDRPTALLVLLVTKWAKDNECLGSGFGMPPSIAYCVLVINFVQSLRVGESRTVSDIGELLQSFFVWCAEAPEIFCEIPDPVSPSTNLCDGVSIHHAQQISRKVEQSLAYLREGGGLDAIMDIQEMSTTSRGAEGSDSQMSKPPIPVSEQKWREMDGPEKGAQTSAYYRDRIKWLEERHRSAQREAIDAQATVVGEIRRVERTFDVSVDSRRVTEELPFDTLQRLQHPNRIREQGSQERPKPSQKRDSRALSERLVAEYLGSYPHLFTTKRKRSDIVRRVRGLTGCKVDELLRRIHIREQKLEIASKNLKFAKRAKLLREAIDEYKIAIELIEKHGGR